VSVIRFGKRATPVTQLVYLSCADLLFSGIWVARILARLNSTSGTCAALMVVNQFSGLCSWMWVSIIALDTCMILSRADKEKHKRLHTYQHAAWVIAGLITFVTVLTDGYFQSTTWDEKGYCNSSGSNHAVSEVVFMVLVVLFFTGPAIAYCLIVSKARRCAPESAASHLATNSCRYMLAFFICWLPSLVGTALQWPDALLQIQVLLEPMQGFLNFLAYYVASRRRCYRASSVKGRNETQDTMPLIGEVTKAGPHLFQSVMFEDANMGDGDSESWRTQQQGEMMKQKNATDAQVQSYMQVYCLLLVLTLLAPCHF
jgi:hypothetical protein